MENVSSYWSLQSTTREAFCLHTAFEGSEAGLPKKTLPLDISKKNGLCLLKVNYLLQGWLVVTVTGFWQNLLISSSKT